MRFYQLRNNMKKPTGRSGEDTNDSPNHSIEIQRKILDKSALGILGASSDDDKRFVPSSPSLSMLLSSLDGEVIPGTELQAPPYPFRPTMLLHPQMAMKLLLMLKPPVVLHLPLHRQKAVLKLPHYMWKSH